MATCMRKVSFAHLFRNNRVADCKKSSWLQRCRHTEISSTAVKNQTKEVSGLSNATQNETSREIKFPKRKKRDELTVLKCLAETVQRDSTAPHYMFLDDPFLYPVNDRQKKTYRASRVSGRKAAQYMIELCPKPFMTDMFFEAPSDPPIKDFMPKVLQYKPHEICEEALIERIELRKVSDSIYMYRELKKQDVSVSEEIMLSLLHLLTVYNSQDPKPENSLEEVMLTKGFKPIMTATFVKSWKNNGPAEEVFDDLQNKTPEAYCSLIKGMAKHLETEKARELYDEMVSKGMPVDVGTYNELIKMHKAHMGDQRYKSVMQILNTMNATKVQPNIQTFLNILNVLRGNARAIREMEVFKVINEMNVLNIDLTLGICAVVLKIVTSAEENIDHPILEQLLTYIESKQLEVTSPEDMSFFNTAMSICSSRHDVELAKRIDALLNTKDHVKFMMDIDAENAYCQKYFMLICQYEPLDKCMEEYERLVPNIWTPRYSGILDLFDAIELQNGYKYMPGLWSDLKLLNYLVIWVMSPYFEIISKEKHDPELQDKFTEIVENLLNRWDEDREENFNFSIGLTGQIIGYLIKLSLDGNRFDLAWRAFEIYISNYMKDPPESQISKEAIEMLCEECNKQDETDKAAKCEQLLEKKQFHKKEGKEKDQTVRIKKEGRQRKRSNS